MITAPSTLIAQQALQFAESRMISSQTKHFTSNTQGPEIFS